MVEFHQLGGGVGGWDHPRRSNWIPLLSLKSGLLLRRKTNHEMSLESQALPRVWVMTSKFNNYWSNLCATSWFVLGNFCHWSPSGSTWHCRLVNTVTVLFCACASLHITDSCVEKSSSLLMSCLRVCIGLIVFYQSLDLAPLSQLISLRTLNLIQVTQMSLLKIMIVLTHPG